MKSSVYQLFAKILDYPTAQLWEPVGNCIAELSSGCAEGAALLRRFEAVVTQGDLGQMQELYSSTFDMRADCSLYIGHHVFGNDPRRGLFMAKLKEDYRKYGVSCGSELPDHLPVMLCYLAARRSGEDTEDLITECVIPAVERIVQELERNQNPYAAVLQALSHVLTNRAGVLAVAAVQGE